MKKVQTDLLRILANHLQNGPRAHANFRFDGFSAGPWAANGCGTTGCAVAELPAVWPANFEWPTQYAGQTDEQSTLMVYTGHPRKLKRMAYIDACAKIFNTTPAHFYELFSPSGAALPLDAKPFDVAVHIQIWCNRYDAKPF